MSYCRWSECDVYAYDSYGGVQFYVAGNKGLDCLCRTYQDAYKYAISLRTEHGLDVPDHAIEALRSEALEEAVKFNGPNSVVADLKTENDKLRKLAQWASTLMTAIMPYVDYSRCTALEAVAAWKVEASNLGIEANE